MTEIVCQSWTMFKKNTKIQTKIQNTSIRSKILRFDGNDVCFDLFLTFTPGP
jgi:hypothetical protein